MEGDGGVNPVIDAIIFTYILSNCNPQDTELVSCKIPGTVVTRWVSDAATYPPYPEDQRDRVVRGKPLAAWWRA